MGREPITCSSCGYAFPEREPRGPCPKCGGTSRTFHKLIEARAEGLASLRVRQRRPGFPGFVIDLVQRTKRSLRGLLARESLVIDRSDPQKTLKRHFVEERQPDGSWETVENHKDEWKAKRRPK